MLLHRASAQVLEVGNRSLGLLVLTLRRRADRRRVHDGGEAVAKLLQDGLFGVFVLADFGRSSDEAFTSRLDEVRRDVELRRGRRGAGRTQFFRLADAGQILEDVVELRFRLRILRWTGKEGGRKKERKINFFS